MSFLLGIGCYTSGTEPPQGSQGEGILIGDFDSKSGAVSVRETISDIQNPSYLAGDLCGRWFAVSETIGRESAVVAFETSSSSTRKLWSSPSAGEATCHLAVLPGNAGVAAASYLGGTAVVFDGATGEPIHLLRYQGTGPNVARQEASHPHQIVVSPCGRWMLVPDLGADVIWAHRILEGGVEPEAVRSLELPPGTGPRHLVFSHDSATFFVLGELDAVVHAASWDSNTGTASLLASVETLEQHLLLRGKAQGSAIRSHPCAPVLYAANRSAHTIAVVDVSNPSAPAVRAIFPSGEQTPRDIAVSPDGSWLLAAGQDSHGISFHRIASDTGLPTGDRPVNRFACGSPVCIHFQNQPS